MKSIDISYLQQALQAAKTRRGYCAPNPAVGAVIVKDNCVIAIGVHRAAGHPHAEIEALHKAGDAAQGASLYVTLEPCCHQGATPPCTEAILAAGIQRVVFGFRDPNTIAAHGSKVLAQADVTCEQITLPEIDLFYRSYVYWVRYHRPWLTVKLAISADYKIAGEGKVPVPITGALCHALTQESRYRADALLTTVRTIINDDPQMNARLPNKTVAKPVFVLDSHLQLNRSARLFKTAKSITVYHRDDVPAHEDLCCVAVPYNQQGLDLTAVLEDLGQRGFHDIWAEVGARAFDSFCRDKIVNEVILYRSKKILGELAQAALLSSHQWMQQSLHWQVLGEDKVARLTLA